MAIAALFALDPWEAADTPINLQKLDAFDK